MKYRIVGILLLIEIFGAVNSARATSSWSIDSQNNWGTGVASGVEAVSNPGDLKLKTAGEWEQRAWATPDIALTTGTAVGSDGTYVYALAGGDTWFARYDSTNNSWQTLAPAPYTAYYGSDMVYLNGYMYVIFGGYQNLFARYDIANNTWTVKAQTPDLVYRGGSIETDGTNLFATRGGGTSDFWKYTVADDTWGLASSTPATLNQGATLRYHSGYLYTPRGGGVTTFYRYSVSLGTWSTRAALPAAINDDTKADVRGDYIYVPLGNNTTTFYRYSITGNSWSAMATMPQTTRYVGLTYNSSDDRLYVFRGNGTYEMWKYEADTNSFEGPADLTATPGSGADLVYYNGYIYQPRGGNTTNFYRYSIAGGTWSSLAAVPATLNDDTTGVAAGSYLYFFRGGNVATFYRYDPAGNTWSSMADAPGAVRFGGSLTYPGSGDYIYATRGNYTTGFWRYSISSNTWDDASVSDLPNNSESSYGSRLVSDGTDLYYLSGSRTGALLKYTVSSNSWSAVSLLPYAPYWGTDAVYWNGSIYVQGGYYKGDFWRYVIATGTWMRMDNLQQYYGWESGPYNGAALAVDTSNGVFYSMVGASILNMASFDVEATDYLASGTWTSEVHDLSYVTSFVSLTTTKTTPSDSSVTIETRTSSDKSSWSSWASVSGSTITSPANRYLQVRVTLNSSSSQAHTPTLSDLTVTYNGDTTAPSNPVSFSGTSTEVGGTTLTSGATYRHNYPYFSWSGASDGESGLDGYYVYFGTNSSADPATLGSYQTEANYVVTANLTTGDYYLRVKTRDKGGNVSAAVEGFHYVYQGVVYTSLTKTSALDFAAGTLSEVSGSSDSLKLSGKAGFWEQSAPALTPASLNYGSGLAYDSAGNNLYATRGSNSNSFYKYDLGTSTWSSMANAPATVSYGGDIVEGPSGYLYAFRGANTASFWRYDISGNTWDDGAASDSPQSIYYGSSLIYDNATYIYALRGNNDDTFLRYDTSADSWSSMASVDFGATAEQVNNTVNYGGDLAYDGSSKIYAVQGNTRTGFASYSVVDNTWTQLAKTPAAVYQGGQIEYDATSNAVYLIPGWGKPYIYKYSVASGTWSELDEGPGTFGLGTSMRLVGDKLYVMRASNTRSVYIYDITKSKWLVPTRGLFGAIFQGTDTRTIGTGADLVKGEGNYLYMTRGNNDNLFVRYDTASGEKVQLAGLPGGQNIGGALAYDEDEHKVYATTSQYDDNLYVYSVASNSWSSEASDHLPIDPNSGASLAYDGARYVYYARGGGGTNFYRFDTDGTAGSKWATLASIPAGVSYGAQLVAKGSYVYTMRGNNTTPNNLYRYDVSGGTWSSLASLSDRIYNDGFLVDGGGDYLFACRGGNTTLCYRYSISGDSWSAIAAAPGEIYQGGAGASDGTRLYTLAGNGTNSFNDGLYSYVMEGSLTSVEESGSYISQSLNLGEVYRFANLSLTYQDVNGGGLTVSTRTSVDGTTWESWVEASEEKHVGAGYEYKIASPVHPYIQVKFEMTSGEGVYTPSINDYTINYYSDTAAPSNASNLSAYSTATMSASLVTDTWYNYATPYFDWPDAELTGGASDTSTGSSVVGYYVYLGTNASADPAVAGTYITASNLTASALVSGNTYYLRVKSKDDAGNVSSSVWAPFVYKYDADAPSAPTGLSADPSGYTALNNFDFDWDSATDSASGVTSYCYKTATASGALASDQCTSATSVTGITGYQTGTNTFYVRTKDIAGNYSAYTTGSFYYNSGAPSAPTSLGVTPATNTVNSFEFSWSAPSAYYGSAANLKYYYSVNALPTAASVTRAYSNSLGASSYATLPGDNTLYVVAMDEAGNIDYSAYASVVFTANTTAPGIPTNLDIADVSVKVSSSWKLALSWEAPTNVGAGVATYQVWRSTDNTTFSSLASTSGISYVDTNLTQVTYYYKIRACDSANNCGAFSSVVSLLPDGKYTSAAPLLADPTVDEITTKKATISWTTSRTADSKVAYGTASGDYVSAEVGNSDQVTAHEVALDNLSPGTTYYYTAKWSDEDGNLGSSDEGTFTTSPAPSAKEVKAVSIGLDSTIIQFTSANAKTAKIYYGPTTTFGGVASVGVGTAESTYSIQLTGLLDGTKYYYKISLLDSEDNVYDGDTYSFETLPRPKITGVKLQQVKGTATGTILLTWSTNTAVSSIVTYYPSANPSAAKDSIDVKLATAHRALIEGLLPNTAYTAIVKGRDKVGNEAISESQTFTTATDTRPPTIANLKVEPVVQGTGEEATVQLVVSWDSDELSTSQVTYGEGASGELSNKTQEDSARTFNHMVVVSNLSPARVYHLRALSSDEGNNTATSIDRVVITPTATKSALNLVVSNLSQAFGFLGGLAGGQK